MIFYNVFISIKYIFFNKSLFIFLIEQQKHKNRSRTNTFTRKVKNLLKRKHRKVISDDSWKCGWHRFNKNTLKLLPTVPDDSRAPTPTLKGASPRCTREPVTMTNSPGTGHPLYLLFIAGEKRYLSLNINLRITALTLFFVKIVSNVSY